MPATANPSEPAAHMRPLDMETMRATVEHALARGPLPRDSDLQEMEARLRRYLEVLLPQAELAGVCPDLLKGAHAHLQENRGVGLRSAIEHVRDLAGDTRHVANALSDQSVRGKAMS